MNISSQQPALFISHGSPMIVMEPSPAHMFLTKLGTMLERPRAILSVSAHWTTDTPAISVDPQPGTMHDFGGFPDELYQMSYPAPGAPDVGEAAALLLRDQGIIVDIAQQRDLDHGTWTPLKLAYPNADIPITEMSVQPHQSPAWHFRLGEALAPLRNDNILIVGSGAMTHNLRAFFGGEYDTPPSWVTDFTDWMYDTIAQDHVGALLDFETAAPHIQQNHPTVEHILPLFVALGAGSADTPGERIHTSIEHGVLSMDMYRFD